MARVGYLCAAAFIKSLFSKSNSQAMISHGVETVQIHTSSVDSFSRTKAVVNIKRLGVVLWSHIQIDHFRLK
jgi:uncharacterized membrane protein